MEKGSVGNKFEEFLVERYKDQLEDVVSKYPEEKSIIIDYSTLEEYNTTLADLLLENPDNVIKTIESAVKSVNTQGKDVDINARFTNIREDVPLRELKSKYIGKLITTVGIVRKTSEVSPRILVGVYECRSCLRRIQLQQKDNVLVEPALCQECGGKGFNLLQDESLFLDTQTVRIQEPLEELSGGEQPRQTNIILEDDLVDTVAPGNNVKITGVMKTSFDKKNKRFKNYIYGNYIETLEEEYDNLDISQEEWNEIVSLAEDPDVYNKIRNSIAPTIYGHEEIKQAVALQLFGGVSTQLGDGTHVRGDIHILIVGDPGTSKSVLLKFVSRLAPRGIYTGGKGASGAGLTAAAVKDEQGWGLEAGALVIGDKGIVCIDEMDKMKEEDRSAIHESLEQQTISISKAGIMATLNTRCSVLAAANPKQGRFDRYKSMGEQIDLPPTILSRFDLTFMLEDNPNRNRDEQLAKYILDRHGRGIAYGVDPSLLKKYIAYSKEINPELTIEAKEELVGFYKELRNAGNESDPLPITARQLEALVRLSEAYARMRLSDVVTKQDAKMAIELEMMCLQKVGMDDNGSMDIDKVEGRLPKTDRDKMSLIPEIILRLEDEFEGKCPVNILYHKLNDEYNIDKKSADKILNILRRDSIIFEPENGYLKLV